MKVVKNILFNGLYKSTAILVPLLTVTYATRVLGPENYGYAVGFLALIAFFFNLPSLPFGAFAVSELSRLEGDKKNKVTDVFLGLGFILSLFCCIAFMFVLYMFTGYSNVYVISLAFVTISCASLSLEWYYQYKGEFKRLFIRTIIIRLLALLLIFTLVITPEDYIVYTLVLLLMLLVPNMYNLYFYSSKEGINFKQIFCLSEIKSYIPSLTRNAMIGFTISIYTLLPIAIASIYLTGEQFSYISLPDRIIKLIISLTASFSIVLLPKQVELFKSSKEDAKRYIIKVINITIVLSVLFMFIVFSFADYFVLILAGKSFAESGDFLRGLSPLLLLMPLNSILIYQFYYAKNESKKLLKITLLTAIVSVAIIVSFLNLFSVTGYILSVLLIELLLFSLLYVRAFCLREALSLFCKIIVCILVLFVTNEIFIMFVADLNITKNEKLISGVIISTLAYFTFIYLNYFFTRKDKARGYRIL